MKAAPERRLLVDVSVSLVGHVYAASSTGLELAEGVGLTIGIGAPPPPLFEPLLDPPPPPQPATMTTPRKAAHNRYNFMNPSKQLA
jgi:hypothetical protein